jgi:chromosome partitioning protein|tara:strand:+ start:174 stop:947 length:774 start_codon:yes stop_codon:yes gene_type:complete
MIVTFAHYKGGTGKTTSCINIAGYLAKKGKKVLAIDLDPQGNLTSGLGVDKKTVEESTFHLMNKRKDIENLIVETEIENLHLAPATSELALTNIKSYRTATQARVLERSIKKIKSSYDFILIDTPPVHSHFIINGMAAADRIILVLDPGIFALEGITTLQESFGQFFKKINLPFNIHGALITKTQDSFLPWKKKHGKEIKQNVEGLLARKAFTIPFSNDIYESHQRGLPISHLKPRSKVGKAYKKVADMLLKEARQK